MMTGQTITHYRVGEKLGEGGSAVVYRAEDLALGREVVIKFFTRDHAGNIARLQHEARTISSLNHPNICTIYEIGEHDGRHFLVMELLDGQVLSQAIGAHPLTIARVIDLGTQIADALDAAHSEGIVHRDVKPANIFVTRSGRVKLLDFGVAVMLPRRVDSTTARSLTSTTGGTIPYMSPEQARVEELDHRTDLFSLGIVLYEMAAGRRPFAGETAAAVLSSISNQPPAGLRELNPEVPAELERMIMKALEKNPALRYQTASDLRADLQRLKRDLDRATGVPSGVSGQPSWQQWPHWWRTAAIAGAFVMAGAGWLVIAAARAKPASTTPAEAALLPAGTADAAIRPEIESAKKAPAAASEASAPHARVRPEAPPSAPPPLPSGTPVAALPARPVISASPSPLADDDFRIARQQIDLKLYDQAIDVLRRVAQGGDRKKAIEASFLIASIHDTRADTANAMSTYIEIANRFPEDPRAAEALSRLAEATLKSNHRDREFDAQRMLTELVQKYPASPWAPQALLRRGDLEARQKAYQRDNILGGSVPTAAITYREIVEKYASSDEAAPALNKLARIYTDAKRFEIAAATLQDLAMRDTDGRYDAWFSAGEIYEKRLDDSARARAAYARVPPSSPHYADARKRIPK
jgi:TolA-binding protein/predicted Ser/Thr protein kinase